MLGLQLIAANNYFFPCKQELSKETNDRQALVTIMQAHADGYRFSSECLELVLLRNYMDTVEYLLNEYYPSTNIDTEITVRSVANEIQRQQDYTIFQLKQKMLEKGETFPTSRPVVYWAQSPEDVLVMIKLQPEMDEPMCKQSFDKNVLMDVDMLRLQVFCMQFTRNITQGVAKNEQAEK